MVLPMAWEKASQHSSYGPQVNICNDVMGMEPGSHIFVSRIPLKQLFMCFSSPTISSWQQARGVGLFEKVIAWPPHEFHDVVRI